MQRLTIVAAITLLFVGNGTATLTTPVVGVVKELKKAKAGMDADLKKEQLDFASEVQSFKEEQRAETKNIADAKDDIEKQSTIISQNKATMAAMDEQLKKLEETKNDLDKQNAEAEDNEKDNEKAYTSEKKHLEETIKAMEEAITAVSANAPALLQTQHAAIRKAVVLAEMIASDADATRLESLRAALGDEPAGDRAGHVSVYDFKGSNVIQMLDQLKRNFEAELTDLTAGRTNEINAYDLATQNRKALLDDNDESTKHAEEVEKEAESAHKEAVAAKGKADKKLKESKTNLDSSISDQKTRTEENAKTTKDLTDGMYAVDKAVDILNGVKSTPLNEHEQPEQEAMPTLETVAADFFQMPSGPKLKAVNLLRASAHATHSKALERLAQEISVLNEQGPDSKALKDVIVMVGQMIQQLQEEQTKEDEHRDWCEKELGTTEDARVEYKDNKEKLEAKRDATAAKIKSLTTQVEKATANLEALVEHKGNVVEVHKAQMAECKKTKQETADAITALDNAKAVMTEYFDTQGGEEDGAGASHKEAVLGIISNVLEKFTKFQADVEETCTTNTQEFKDRQSEIKISTARNQQEATMLQEERSSKEGLHAKLLSDIKHKTKELDGAKLYLKDLEGACGKVGEIKEDADARKQARTEEIEALREAQGILEGGLTTAAPEPAKEKTAPKSKFLQKS